MFIRSSGKKCLTVRSFVVIMVGSQISKHPICGHTPAVRPPGADTMRQCDQSPPGQLLLAIRQFNGGLWYECHETLEELWLGEEGETRNFFQGVLQISVALHHWRNGNFGGAVSLLDGGVKLLSMVPEACLWVDVARLTNDANRMREALEGLGRERMGQLEPSLVPRLQTVSPKDLNPVP